MSRSACRNHPLSAGYGYEPGPGGVYRPAAMDFQTPATDLEQAEDAPLEDERLHEQTRMFRWLFEQYALRADGELHAATGIAIRVLCLASLLGFHPVEGMSLTQIARHCGVTRAAVSKVMLDLSVITGIRSRQQRSEDARCAYRKRAIKVHACKKGEADGTSAENDMGCVDNAATGSSR